MIQKLIEKLNKKRLKERISSAIVMVALIVSISGVVGAVSGIVVGNRYNYALKNYGFSQGDIGKMMITFADTRSYLRAAIGYQDENLVNSCAENYEKKKESCQQYTKEVKNTVSSADEEKIYNSITEKLNETPVMLYWKKERIHRILMRAMKHSRWHRIRWHRSMRRFIRVW